MAKIRTMNFVVFPKKKYWWRLTMNAWNDLAWCVGWAYCGVLCFWVWVAQRLPSLVCNWLSPFGWFRGVVCRCLVWWGNVAFCDFWWKNKVLGTVAYNLFADGISKLVHMDHRQNDNRKDGLLTCWLITALTHAEINLTYQMTEWKTKIFSNRQGRQLGGWRINQLRNKAQVNQPARHQPILLPFFIFFQPPKPSYQLPSPENFLTHKFCQLLYKLSHSREISSSKPTPLRTQPSKSKCNSAAPLVISAVLFHVFWTALPKATRTSKIPTEVFFQVGICFQDSPSSGLERQLMEQRKKNVGFKNNGTEDIGNIWRAMHSIFFLAKNHRNLSTEGKFEAAWTITFYPTKWSISDKGLNIICIRFCPAIQNSNLWSKHTEYQI